MKYPPNAYFIVLGGTCFLKLMACGRTPTWNKRRLKHNQQIMPPHTCHRPYIWENLKECLIQKHRIIRNITSSIEHRSIKKAGRLFVRLLGLVTRTRNNNQEDKENKNYSNNVISIETHVFSLLCAMNLNIFHATRIGTDKC